jgi:hypothetical protein
MVMETVQQADVEEQLAEPCAGCGLSSENWGDPITKDGLRYCCPECAAGRACDCLMGSDSG